MCTARLPPNLCAHFYKTENGFSILKESSRYMTMKVGLRGPRIRLFQILRSLRSEDDCKQSSVQ